MRYLCIVVVLCGVLCGSCNNSNNKTTVTTTDTSKAMADTLMSEVMDGHDVGMAKYGKLNAMEKKVQSIVDSLGKLQAKSAIAMKARMDSLLADIRSARQGMDTWMESFNMDSAANDMRARIRYLTDEKIKVNKVRDDILTVIRKTDSLVRDGLN